MVSLADALSTLKQDYQPKRVTFKDLPSEVPHKLSLNAIPFFPKNQSNLYPQSPPFNPPNNTSPSVTPFDAQVDSVKRELSQKSDQLEQTMRELETLRVENENLRELKHTADTSKDRALSVLDEKIKICEEAERRVIAATERAVSAEKKILLINRNKTLDCITTELIELDRLSNWTEMNSKNTQHTLQLRTHTESVRELLKRVTEQYQSQFDQLDRGLPLSGLSRINSELPTRPIPIPIPIPVPEPIPYLPTDVEVYLPCANFSDPVHTGYAQPRYGPQMFPSRSEDVHNRLIRKLSNWHSELTDSELYGYIIDAKKAATGQSFSGMSMSEIITSVHELIVNRRIMSPPDS
ncbi:hypothetical protein LOD99_6773 [Oopsacas minuta]|uniref:Uncharacterized protein n=1 Tax=Oopsacas minuta TaxID=111878 RepID=A0AAV7JJF6_9METZ|nr:hypothetical protein LOD99_6773 [Oopsacas minuta]